ncbi:MAG TPA: spore cortex-lytic enzyme [Clostridiales bacterium]|nr:spore cortex-lytic enzyme [Clostridiales bacterium]
MKEISGEKEIKFEGAKSHAKGIVAVILIFVLSVFTLGSIVVAGNLSQGTAISANVTNTRIVQAKLSNLGYYNKEIDGVFDQATIDAIKSYQSDKNLAVTGNLDSATTAALGVTDNAQANSDLYLLAKLIYSEARGEIYQGQVAVGAVVLNRVADAGFPNTLQGVIYQPWAFTALHDGQFSLEPNSTAYSAAQDAMNGWDPTYGCLYYYNPRTATSSWIFSRTIAVTIGNHVFCY